MKTYNIEDEPENAGKRSFSLCTMFHKNDYITANVGFCEIAQNIVYVCDART